MHKTSIVIQITFIRLFVINIFSNFFFLFSATQLAEEEMVANMVYNFLLPEVEKNTIRKNIREKQQAYLQNAHATIYNEILNLSPVENTNSSTKRYDKI